MPSLPCTVPFPLPCLFSLLSINPSQHRSQHNSGLSLLFSSLLAIETEEKALESPQQHPVESLVSFHLSVDTSDANKELVSPHRRSIVRHGNDLEQKPFDDLTSSRLNLWISTYVRSFDLLESGAVMLRHRSSTAFPLVLFSR